MSESGNGAAKTGNKITVTFMAFSVRLSLAVPLSIITLNYLRRSIDFIQLEAKVKSLPERD